MFQFDTIKSASNRIVRTGDSLLNLFGKLWIDLVVNQIDDYLHKTFKVRNRNKKINGKSFKFYFNWERRKWHNRESQSRLGNLRVFSSTIHCSSHATVLDNEENKKKLISFVFEDCGNRRVVVSFRFFLTRRAFINFVV